MCTLRLVVSIVVVSLLLLGCSAKDDRLDSINIDEAILEEMAAANIPSVVACVFKDTEIVWKNAYGMANRENNEHATTETLYPTMSISKLIIVTAAMQLVERGLLDLDVDISQYLPFSVRNAYPEYSNEIVTPRMLLNHTSGIINPPGFFEDFPYDGAPPLKEWLFEYFTKPDHYDLWLRCSPGDVHRYSNTGSALMAYIVEVITETDYNEYCKDNIFLPLDMPNTSHRFADLDENNIAFPYGHDLEPFDFLYSHRDYPAGFLMSSVEEFTHFMMAYMNDGEYAGHRILAKETVAEILTVHNSRNGMCKEWFYIPCPTSGGRMLWFRAKDDWYGHNGGDDAGYTTHAAIQREDRLGIIIFANGAAIEDSPVFPTGSIYNLVFRKANEFR